MSQRPRIDGRTERESPYDIDDDVVVSIRNATVTFEMDRGTSKVLDDVSIDLKRNEILGVVGESGSGKSMLAAAFLDAVPEPGVLSGEVIFNPADGDPFDVTELDDEELRQFRWDDISMVFQGAMTSFNPVRTVETHFVETLRAHDASVSAGLDRAREILSDLHLDPVRVLESYPHELSGGMRQRALIALSVVLEPEVLVMDEPTAALDLLMQRSIVSLIEDLQEKYDLTILFITHDLPLIAGLTDRLAVMYAFDVVEAGPSMDLLTDATHPYTRALLRSTPNLDAPLDEMRSIEGSSPDPVDVPDGCAFRDRCAFATDACQSEDPPLEPVDESRTVACHHWRDVDDEPFDVVESTVDASAPTSASSEPPPQSGDPLVSLEGVSVEFTNGDDGLLSRFLDTPETVHAVSDVSLDVHENDVVVVVGESGCGKSTLGRTAVGIQEPTDGTVRYRGQDVWQSRRRYGDIHVPWQDIRRNLQIIHQDPASSLNAERRVKSILADPLKRWHPELDAERRRSTILGLLQEVGMKPAEDYIERYPYQLSGGEKQRVALVRAFMTNPDLIFADEPVSALDVSLRVEMMDLMIRLQERFGTSFLLVSHDLANARYIAGRTGGRIAVMYLGEIVEIGPPEAVIHDPQHPYTEALRWSTPELTDGDDVGDGPIRSIDVPDPTDPPSGCRYHTRCPYARKACTRESPTLQSVDESSSRAASCFRQDPSHEYWDSPALDDAEK